MDKGLYMDLKGLKEIEALAVAERKEYFVETRRFCENRRAKKQTNPFILWNIAKLSPLFRGLEIEYEGLENIPGDEIFGFHYDTSLESQFLLKGESGVENEYCLDEQGDFVPEILKK